MTCAVCKHEWCWICGADYYGYRNHNADWCNKYIDQENLKVRNS